MSGAWVRVAATGDIGREPVPVAVDGRAVLVVRTDDGVIRAFDAACPHLANPLRRGEIDGCVLECPHHFYAYDLRTGRNTFPGDKHDLRLAVHEARVVGDDVEVRLRA